MILDGIGLRGIQEYIARDADNIARVEKEPSTNIMYILYMSIVCHLIITKENSRLGHTKGHHKNGTNCLPA